MLRSTRVGLVDVKNADGGCSRRDYGNIYDMPVLLVDWWETTERNTDWITTIEVNLKNKDNFMLRFSLFRAKPSEEDLIDGMSDTSSDSEITHFWNFII